MLQPAERWNSADGDSNSLDVRKDSDDSEGELEESLVYLETRASPQEISSKDQIYIKVDEMLSDVSTNIDFFTRLRSGLVFKRIVYLKLNLFKNRPLKGGSSEIFVMPAGLSEKKALLNILNGHKDHCFLLAILAFLNPQLPTWKAKRASTFKSLYSQINYHKGI